MVIENKISNASLDAKVTSIIPKGIKQIHPKDNWPRTNQIPNPPPNPKKKSPNKKGEKKLKVTKI